MHSTRRAVWVLMVLVAVALAAEPLLHSHPLDSRMVCTVCATAASTALPGSPTLPLPDATFWLVASAPLLSLARVPQAPSASRAPPSV